MTGLATTFPSSVFPVVSFAVTFALTPLCVAISSCYRFFDSPGPLKIHSRPVPRLGGIALTIGLFTGDLLSPQMRHIFLWYSLAALLFPRLAGFLEDLCGLSVSLWLAAQIVATSLLYLDGWRLPFTVSGWSGWLALTVFSLICINAFNFLDGSDALASGIACTIALGFAVPCVHASASPTTPAVVFLAAWLAGDCSAFLFFNIPPARIFLGDSGSAILGFGFVLLSAVLPTSRFRTNRFRRICLALFRSIFLRHLYSQRLFSFSIFSSPFFRRLRRGAPPFLGDRRHFYELLLARGWSSSRVEIAFVAITALLVFLGCAAWRWNPQAAATMLGACPGILAVIGWRLGAARPENPAG